MSSIELLAADGDGALYDTMVSATEATLAATRQLEESTTREEIIALFGQGISLHQVFQEVAPHHDPKLTESLFYENEAAIGYDSIVLFPEMAEVLEELYVDYHIAFGIVTNRARPSALHIIQQVGLLDQRRFGLTEEMIVTPSDTIRAKPHPDGVLFLQNLCHATPEQTAMFGDTAGDIATGVNANAAQRIGFTGGFGTRQSMYDAGATAVIDHARELRDLLINPL